MPMFHGPNIAIVSYASNIPQSYIEVSKGTGSNPDPKLYRGSYLAMHRLLPRLSEYVLVYLLPGKMHAAAACQLSRSCCACESSSLPTWLP